MAAEQDGATSVAIAAATASVAAAEAAALAGVVIAQEIYGLSESVFVQNNYDLAPELIALETAAIVANMQGFMAAQVVGQEALADQQAAMEAAQRRTDAQYREAAARLGEVGSDPVATSMRSMDSVIREAVTTLDRSRAEVLGAALRSIAQAEKVLEVTPGSGAIGRGLLDRYRRGLEGSTGLLDAMLDRHRSGRRG